MCGVDSPQVRWQGVPVRSRDLPRCPPQQRNLLGGAWLRAAAAAAAAALKQASAAAAPVKSSVGCGLIVFLVPLQVSFFNRSETGDEAVAAMCESDAQQCRKGARGILCGSCEDGYTLNNALGICVECDSVTNTGPIIGASKPFILLV